MPHELHTRFASFSSPGTGLSPRVIRLVGNSRSCCQIVCQLDQRFCVTPLGMIALHQLVASLGAKLSE